MQDAGLDKENSSPGSVTDMFMKFNKTKEGKKGSACGSIIRTILHTHGGTCIIGFSWVHSSLKSQKS